MGEDEKPEGEGEGEEAKGDEAYLAERKAKKESGGGREEEEEGLLRLWRHHGMLRRPWHVTARGLEPAPAMLSFAHA